MSLLAVHRPHRDARRGTAWIAFELNRANQMVEVAEGGRPGRAELLAKKAA